MEVWIYFLQKFTFIENQTFLWKFYIGAIWYYGPSAHNFTGLQVYISNTLWRKGSRRIPSLEACCLFLQMLS